MDSELPKIVSVDDHVVEPAHVWQTWLPEKHRARAIEIGVNDYLGKPYQENQLLDAIEPLVQARRRKVS